MACKALHACARALHFPWQMSPLHRVTVEQFHASVGIVQSISEAGPSHILPQSGPNVYQPKLYCLYHHPSKTFNGRKAKVYACHLNVSVSVIHLV